MAGRGRRFDAHLPRNPGTSRTRSDTGKGWVASQHAVADLCELGVQDPAIAEVVVARPPSDDLGAGDPYPGR